MPITFGAVGDIISVCLLVKDLVEALDKARGSKAEYQSAIRELWILDRALLEIELFTKAHENASTPELRGLCETSKVAALRCKRLVSTFLERIKKYQTTFDEGKDPGLVRDAVAKVRWRLGEKDALEQFRVEVAGTSSSLQMLLATASVTLVDINRKETEKRYTALGQQNVQSSTQHSEALMHIRQRIDDTQHQIENGNTILNQISSTFRLDWLRQLGSELKGLMRRAIAINIATYHAVLGIQAALPSRLERVLIEDPFILEDPIGRIAPVHLQFVTSWEAFHAVMEHRFSNLQGFRKIQQRKYGLQDRATRREIEQTRSWQRAFLPGQRVEMAFIFQSDEAESANTTNTTCPGCQTPSEDTGNTEIHCQNCLIWYQRITVVQEVEPTSQMPLPQPWKTQPKFGQSDLKINVSGPVPPGRKRVAPDDLEGEEDVRDFKRVRLMRTEKLVKQHQFGVRGSTAYSTFIKLSKAVSSPEQRPQWRPGEATSQHWGFEQPQAQADLELPELPECFRTSKTKKLSSPTVLTPPSPGPYSDPFWFPPTYTDDTKSCPPAPQDLKDMIEVLKEEYMKCGPSPWDLAHYKQMYKEHYRELQQLERNQTVVTSVEGRKWRPRAPALKPPIEYMIGSGGYEELLQLQVEEQDAFPAPIVKDPPSPLPFSFTKSPREIKLCHYIDYLIIAKHRGEPLSSYHTVYILMTKKLREEAWKLYEERLELEDRVKQTWKMPDVQQEEQDARGGLAKSEIDGHVSSKMGDLDKTADKAPVIVARSEDGDGAKRRRLKLSPLSDLEL